MKHLRKFARLFSFVFVTMLVLNLAISVYAQEPSPVEAQSWWKPLLDMAIKTLLPALWLAVGPMTVALVTAGLNKFSVYVPREVQVILSAILTASAAAFTGGDVSGMAAEGAAAQMLAATKPETLRTSAPER